MNIKGNEIGWACNTYGGDEKLIHNVSRKRTVGPSRRRWKDNIKMYLTEIGWEVVYWIRLARYGDS